MNRVVLVASQEQQAQALNRVEEEEARCRCRVKQTFAAITSRSYHNGVVNTGMVDGSIRKITDDISLRIWRGLATRDGGEVANPP